MLDHGCLSEPLPLVKDGDLIAILQHMKVRLEGKLGNAEADTAAALGGRHQSEAVLDAGRLHLMLGSSGIPLCFNCIGSWLQSPGLRLIMTVEGSAPDPTVWDRGSRCKQRKVDIRVNVDLATLPPSFLNGPWVQVHGVLILLPGLLVSVCCVNSSLSWVPDIGRLMLWILGHFYMSYLEVLFLSG